MGGKTTEKQVNYSHANPIKISTTSMNLERGREGATHTTCARSSKLPDVTCPV